MVDTLKTTVRVTEKIGNSPEIIYNNGGSGHTGKAS
jgi:hypothetical protein